MTYLFQHPDTQEIIEVEQLMLDKHEFIDDNGVEWERIFTVPNAFVTEKVDPYSSNQFMNKTNGQNQRLGDLYERSKELSAMRAEKNGGVDPLRQKAELEYSKKRGGRKPPKAKKDINIKINV